MVPKQCPLLRSTFWYLICCATCFGSRDNSKYHTYPPTHPPTHIHDLTRISIDCLTPASRLRRSASVCKRPEEGTSFCHFRYRRVQWNWYWTRRCRKWRKLVPSYGLLFIKYTLPLTAMLVFIFCIYLSYNHRKEHHPTHKKIKLGKSW